MSELVFLGTEDPAVGRLAAVLGVEVTAVPSPEPGADLDWGWGPALDRWRVAMLAADAAPGGTARPGRIVVAPWSPVREPVTVVGTGLAAWLTEAEFPLALWVAAVGVAGRLVDDGGVVVVVVERPSPLDCAGHGPEAAIAEAVEAMMRSLARSEGTRGVRVNLVTTPARLAPAHPVAPAPPLATFPGRVDVEVAGAVRMLLGPDAAGLTGTVVHADAGRSWR